MFWSLKFGLNLEMVFGQNLIIGLCIFKIIIINSSVIIIIY